MRIYLERSGGFAGMRTTFTIDPASFTPQEVKRLQNMLDKADFFNLQPKMLPDPKKGADYFRYKLTIETENKKNTIETTDITMIQPLKLIIDFLMDKGKDVV